MLGKTNGRGETITFTPVVALKIREITLAQQYRTEERIFKESVRREAGIDKNSDEWKFFERAVIPSDEGLDIIRRDFIKFSNKERLEFLKVVQQYQRAAIPMLYEAETYIIASGVSTDIFRYRFFGKGWLIVISEIEDDYGDMKAEVKLLITQLRCEIESVARCAGAIRNLKEGKIQSATGRYRTVIETTPSYFSFVADKLAELVLKEPQYGQSCCEIAYALDNKGVWNLFKQNVESNGGTIDVASEPGKDTTFTVRLPIAGAAPAGQAPLPAAKTIRIGDKLIEYIKSSTGKEIVDIEASSSEQIVESLIKGEVVLINFRNLESNIDKYNSVRFALIGIGVYLEEAFPGISAATDILSIRVPEILKNAFVHGNQLSFKHPIYLYLKQNEDLKILEVFDVASENLANDTEIAKAEDAELCGFGVGERQWLSSAPYKRQAIKDEDGNIIGTVASLALNPKGWDNPLANLPDILIVPAKITIAVENSDRIRAAEQALLPAAGVSGSDSQKDKVSEAFNQFRDVCLAELPIVKRCVESGDMDGVTQSLNKIFDMFQLIIDSSRKDPELDTIVYSVKDSLMTKIGTMRNGITLWGDVEIRNMMLRSLDRMNDNLDALTKLSNAGKLSEWKRARGSSGVLDVSRMLGSEFISVPNARPVATERLRAAHDVERRA